MDGSRAGARHSFSGRLSGIAVFVAASVLAVPGLAAPPASTATPPDVYGRLPSIEDVALSPDGTKLAFVRTSEDARNLYIVRMADDVVLGGARIGDFKLRYVEWIDNDDLLTAVSTTSLPPTGFLGERQEWLQLVVYSLSKHKLLPMTFHVADQNTFNVAAGASMARHVSGSTVLYVPGMYVSQEVLPGLFTYEVASGRMQLIERGGSSDVDWLVDEAGRVAAEFDYSDERKVWKLMAVTGDRHRKTLGSGSSPLDIPWMVGFDSTGTSIIMGFVEHGESVWRPIRMADGSIGAVLPDSETFREPIVDRLTGRIIGGTQGAEQTRYVFFDNELQAHWDAVLRAFPGERVELLSHSDDYVKTLVRVLGPKDGYVYALFDWYSHESVLLGKVYQGLVRLAPIKVVRYQAADGLTIPAILTLPNGREPRGLPLVVLPHGGPAAYDIADFDWWAQALAEQGYAVLQPNYRGSTRDDKLLAAGYGEWGRKMQSDLSDGVRYLAQLGTIDPRRVCIVGASYGGYAALAGVTLDAETYRCAVSVAGLSDLKRFLQWADGKAGRRDNYTERYWNRFMGVSGPSDPLLQSISPIEHVSAVTAPVLLIHGKDDTVVPYEQSEVMERALKRAGKSVELVSLKREDHWLSRSATRLEMLEATVGFLRRNNPPD